MPELNKRLSHWNALHACFCGKWTWEQRRGEYRWQTDAGGFGGSGVTVSKGDPCEVCGYDLTLSPEETLRSLDAKQWSDCIIKGSCFYQEGPMREVFPRDVVGLVLEDCNCDNVILPKGATLEGGCNRNIWEQTDHDDWECDHVTDAPLRPLNEKWRLMQGISVDPADLPPVKLTDAELKAIEQRRADEKALAEAQAKVQELGTKLGVAVEAPREEPLEEVRG